MDTIYRIVIRYKDFTRYIEDVSGESGLENFIKNANWENVMSVRCFIVL